MEVGVLSAPNLHRSSKKKTVFLRRIADGKLVEEPLELGENVQIAS